jgi:hypothetical protein
MMVWMLYEQERKGVVVEKKKGNESNTRKNWLSLAEQEQKEYALPISTHEDGTVKCSSSFKIKK